ncbi:MAG: filamentous hemagglutinin N-terminal domain-containing protein [Pleurocapsa sp.]
MKPWHSLLWGCLLSKAIACSSIAQIIPDGTTDTVIDSRDNATTVDRGDRAGNNLFHSFNEFSIPNGSEVLFNNPDGIANIFSRVTGGKISNIDGLLQVNGNTSLFLINPAGIIFEEGAALNIGGSFVASTADSIVFSDDTEFSATNTNNSSLLTINQPIGLNFGSNIGDVAVNGSSLEVSNGANLALLGGNINLTAGQISAPGGRIELGSLIQTEQVKFNNLTTENITTFDSVDFPPGFNRGNITLANGTNLLTQSEGGGNIGITSSNLELLDGELGASFIIGGILTGASSIDAQAGDVVIDVTESIVLTQGSSILNTVGESTTGNAGNIVISSNDLVMQDGGAVSASNFGIGNAGAITIEATEDIIADGESSLGFDSGIFSTIEESVLGNAGGINITARNLTLTNGGEVSASTSGIGDAGSITISAGNILATGESSSGFASGVFNTVSVTGKGNAGGIEIAADNLSLADGGQISVASFGEGNGGSLQVRVNSLDLGNDASLFASTPTGRGGNINLEIANNLTLESRSLISAQAFDDAVG